MRILSFDSLGGASGDMILAALADLGADIDGLAGCLAQLDIEPFDVVAKPFRDGGLTGTQVDVNIPDHHHHPHRRLADILALIESNNLTDRARAMSIQVFQRLAVAEARVHGTTPEEIHFHEVGAMDSIIDILLSCALLDSLNVDEVAVAPLPTGQGTVQTAHGLLPLPAPATLELLKGHPVVQTEERSELVTPTGAALLTTWKTCSVAPVSEIVRSGNGFGHRKLAGRANLLRATLLETGPAIQHDTCAVLECNLDDTVPELLGSLTHRVLAQGALDAFTTPVQMKKNRPGALLTVLCRPADREIMIDTMFRESTTFGIRESLVSRTVLQRRHVDVQTPYGSIRVKVGTWKGRDITRAPEHDDCAAAAESHGVPVRRVYEAALQAG